MRESGEDVGARHWLGGEGDVTDEHTPVRRAYEARLRIEPRAACLAASRARESALDRMREAIEEERHAENFAAAYAANRRFHIALVAASGDRDLLQQAESAWEDMAAMLGPGSDELTVTTPRDMSAHMGIVDAIVHRQPADAAMLVRRHLERARGVHAS